MAPESVDPQLLDELKDLLRIPSVSTDGGNPEALHAAAEWVAGKVRKAGGDCDLVDVGPFGTVGTGPLVVGELKTGRKDAPTVMIYGHYDVQSPSALEEWESPPFEPEIREGRLFARGASDDKGNFLPLLYVACSMAESGELPVDVRVIVEGEEETGSGGLLRWLDEDDAVPDCCIVFDSGSFDSALPAITLGTRGLVQLKVSVTAADHDLHSGLYGGVALNALHVLMLVLSPLLPNADGVVRPELAEGTLPVPDAELKSWEGLPSPEALVRGAGAWPLSDSAVVNYYRRNWAETSLDVNKLEGGESRTVIPSKASATVSIRLAPGQDEVLIETTMRRLIEDATPPGARVAVTTAASVAAAAFDPEEKAMRLAREAIRRASGVEPLLIRIGGTLPLLAPLERKGIPTIVSGFATFADNFHGPNESYKLESLVMGQRASRELLLALSEL